jgi:hypothetical protein
MDEDESYENYENDEGGDDQPPPPTEQSPLSGAMVPAYSDKPDQDIGKGMKMTVRTYSDDKTYALLDGDYMFDNKGVVYKTSDRSRVGLLDTKEMTVLHDNTEVSFVLNTQKLSISKSQFKMKERIDKSNERDELKGEKLEQQLLAAEFKEQEALDAKTSTTELWKEACVAAEEWKFSEDLIKQICKVAKESTKEELPNKINALKDVAIKYKDMNVADRKADIAKKQKDAVKAKALGLQGKRVMPKIDPIRNVKADEDKKRKREAASKKYLDV